MAKSGPPKPKIIGIVGPTSSGKTALAIKIAKRIGGEVISVDSRQVYKGLNLGTGKVTKREMEGVPHHLLDVASPKQVFSVSEFVTLGRKAINDILSRGKVPILCGGTGLYFDALLGRVSIPEVPPNPKLRATLARKTPAQLYALLQKRDPRRAKEIDRHNPVRLIRALEIAQALGSVPKKVRASSPYDCLTFGISVDMEILKEKIHQRLLIRIRSGMLREARTLHTHGLSYKRMEDIGLEYRFMARHLQNKLSREDMIRELERAIVQYAKRQMTWFKRNKTIHWVSPENQKEINSRIATHLGRII